MIKKEGSVYKLYTRDGKQVLGTHKTRMDAEKQEQAIKAAEHRANQLMQVPPHLRGSLALFESERSKVQG